MAHRFGLLSEHPTISQATQLISIQVFIGFEAGLRMIPRKQQLGRGERSADA
jgi:hypothetical protein